MEPNNINPQNTKSGKTLWVLVVLVIIIGAVWYFISMGQSGSQNSAISTSTPTETIQAILNSLKANATSTLSDAQKEKILNSLKTEPSEASLSDAQKLQILNQIKSQ
ncbi:MAG TPA: hypothetical protein VMR73_00945 [Candidatus Paceibacterota bacterium]|nr:hypothetical protein [Candidatus Paceibacterota bacterium]